MTDTIVVLHIVVIGYWLGADLVINSTFRYVSRAAEMPFVERERLLDHVLDVDQHVRYALILQIGFGLILSGLLGFLPGGNGTAVFGVVIAVGWLTLVELTHRLRKRVVGQALVRLDRGLRYALIGLLFGVCALTLAGALSLAGWLGVKLGLFGGVVACGLGIRLELIRYFRVWHEIKLHGSTRERETLLRERYTSATAVLLALWGLIISIVIVSILKPAL